MKRKYPRYVIWAYVEKQPSSDDAEFEDEIHGDLPEPIGVFASLDEAMRYLVICRGPNFLEGDE